MPFAALLLVLTAALLHAGWNLLLKQTAHKYIVIWWSTLVAVMLGGLVLAMQGPPPPNVWPLLVLSALVETAYMASLSSAYEWSDFSLVYPIARGTAPAFLALWSVLLLGETLTGLGFAGLALIVVGLALVGGSGLFEQGSSTKQLPVHYRRGAFLALGVALLISIYQTIDGAAVHLTEPTGYTMILLGLNGLMFTPLAWKRYGWPTMLAVGRQRWRRALMIGLLGLAAYILVLNAYAIAPVSYGGAVREASIVFGALAGWKVLGEPMGRLRLLGAGIMFAGILLIALA